MLTALELTGRSCAHLKPFPELGCALHPGAGAALLELKSAARSEGIELAVVSGYRDLGRQSAIWNGKFRGERPLLDRRGVALEPARLADRDVVEAILARSAWPGASRHHWGSDVDLIDRAALSAGHRIALTPQAFSNGTFARLSAWLDAHAHRFGFFRPYARDRGGVLPQPWHWSYAALSVPALGELSLERLGEAVAISSMDARERVLARLVELYERYVIAVDAP